MREDKGRKRRMAGGGGVCAKSERRKGVFTDVRI